MHKRRSPWGRGTARRVAPLALATVIAVLTLVPSASAASFFALRALPKGGFFVLRATPGETITKKVLVTNRGTKAGVAHVFAVDGTTGNTSGAVYRLDADKRKDVGAWTTVSPARVSLAPGKSGVVTVVTHVPAHVRPGDHLGGIVAQGKPVVGKFHRRGAGRFRVNLQTLSILALELKLPGTRQVKLELQKATAGGTPQHQQVLIRMANTGNMLFKGRGTMKVIDDNGRTVYAGKQKFAINTFVPQTSIPYPVQILGKALAPGHYRAIVHVRYRGRLVSAVLPFGVTDDNIKQVFGGGGNGTQLPGSHGTPTWLLVLGGLALIALSFGAALMWFRRRLAAVAAPADRRSGDSDAGGAGRDDDDEPQGPAGPGTPVAASLSQQEELAAAAAALRRAEQDATVIRY